MASGFMNMISYWFFLSSVIMISSLFVEAGPANQVDYLSSFKCIRKL
jgi:purine-cytosine permease-like protein